MTAIPFNPRAAILAMAPTIGYAEIARRCDCQKSNVAGWASGHYLPGRVRWKMLEDLWAEFQLVQQLAKVQITEQRTD